EEEDIPQVTKDVPSLAQSPELVKTPRYSGLISPPPMLVALLVPLRPHLPLKGLRRSKKTCFVCKSKTHLIMDYDFHARKLAQHSYASRDIHKHNAQMKYSRIPLHKVSAVAPSKSQPVLTTAARTIRAVKSKFSKARPNITPYAVSKSKSPFRKPFIRHTSPKPSISPPRVNAGNPSAVSAARVNAAVSAAKINAVKSSAVTAVQHNHTKKVWRPKTLVLDHAFRTTSASMTLKRFDYNDALGRSKSELNGGYVAFGGNPKGGKITSKGKIKTGKLDFDDVYFVKELKFNLFSVSQISICENMESVSAQMVAAAKLPVLNLGEFGLWKMRIEQYFLMTDYALWEVIVNGDSPPPKRTIDGVEQTYPPKTAEEKLARKNELQARESKKTQKILLKQQYENFNGSSSEGLDQTYDRLQNLISQLEILGETIYQEDMNLKLLRSLPSEWKTHTLI
nr:hypothetical protein [Tanacetum cinerariifolium]